MLDLLALAKRIDAHADAAWFRGSDNAAELSALAIALRAKHYQRLADRRLPPVLHVGRDLKLPASALIPVWRRGQFQCGCRRCGETR